MTLLSSEIVLYKSQTITETSSNGGRRGTAKVTSGAVNNLFPLVLPEERVAGARKVRKVFASVDNDDDETLYSAGIYIDAPTPGGDWVTMFAGTQRDTMADHTGMDGETVELDTTLADCERFLDGAYDQLTEDACYMRGAMPT